MKQYEEVDPGSTLDGNVHTFLLRLSLYPGSFKKQFRTAQRTVDDEKAERWESIVNKKRQEGD